MQRGEQNKWRTEFASKRGKKKQTKTKTPQKTQSKKKKKSYISPHWVLQFAHQIQVHATKNLALVCCKWVKPVLSIEGVFTNMQAYDVCERLHDVFFIYMDRRATAV